MMKDPYRTGRRLMVPHWGKPVVRFVFCKHVIWDQAETELAILYSHLVTGLWVQPHQSTASTLAPARAMLVLIWCLNCVCVGKLPGIQPGRGSEAVAAQSPAWVRPFCALRSCASPERAVFSINHCHHLLLHYCLPWVFQL